MSKLSTKEKATNYETMVHIGKVRDNISAFILMLLERARLHDLSKLQDPELPFFVRHTPDLEKIEYGTQEYLDNLKNIQPALDHHYANNRHHPQHFKEGINEMNLIDLMEMMADWKASTERNKNGNLRKSLEHNAKRFGISGQLLQILENTLEIMDR